MKKRIKYISPDATIVEVGLLTVIAQSATWDDGSARGIDEIYDL